MGIYGTRDGKFHVKKLYVEDKVPVSYSINYAVATANNYFVDGWDVSAGTTAKLTKHLLLQPPYPVEMKVYASAAGTAGGGDKLIFVGYDAKGEYVKEEVYIAATAATSTYSSNAFAKITSITPDDALHKSTDVNIGFRNVVGLPYPLESASDILTAQIGIQFATAALTVDTTYNSIDLNTALVGGSSASITWMSKVQ